ncbi:c-type cytochrome [Novosphingobium terrae]|uniref:c-type cytochrome n=1 Tax=Novosphingobium terrae TaxID=2726189 RepID=UPI0019803E52|nr:cytochrome c [Novosphingobium terrae]
MTKQALIAGRVAVGLLAVSVTIAAFGQGGQHGIPQPEKVYGDGVTWPLKVKVWQYDVPKMIEQAKVPEDVKAGRILWVQKCAYCHDGVGSPTYRTMGPWLGEEMIANIGEANAKNFIKNGDVRMPAFKYNLEDEQIDHLIAFLKTVKSDQKPTATQLSGRGEGQAASD